MRAMRKKMKLSSDGGDFGSKKCKRGCGGDVLGGCLEPVLCWCVWQGSGFSRREDVFTLNLLHKEMLLIVYFQCDLQRMLE
jgi:hypothetical protein